MLLNVKQLRAIHARMIVNEIIILYWRDNVIKCAKCDTPVYNIENVNLYPTTV